jgi:hypothetical protein
MLTILIYSSFCLTNGYNKVEIEEREGYSFTLPSSSLAYVITNVPIDNQFEVTLQNHSQVTYKGPSDSKVQSFRVDTNEVILKSLDDDADIQIWVVPKGHFLCFLSERKF